MKKKVIYNKGITAKEVRLVGENGAQIITRDEALELAYEQDKDLILIHEDTIPIVKIYDLSKYLYNKKKEAKEKKKNSQQVCLKTLQCRLVTNDHDLDILIKKANKFLLEGNKVKFKAKFRRRESSRMNESESFFEKIKNRLLDISLTDKPMEKTNRDCSIILVPKKKK